jgi:hypothetical protein
MSARIKHRGTILIGTERESIMTPFVKLGIFCIVSSESCGAMQQSTTLPPLPLSLPHLLLALPPLLLSLPPLLLTLPPLLLTLPPLPECGQTMVKLVCTENGTALDNDRTTTMLF